MNESSRCDSGTYFVHISVCNRDMYFHRGRLIALAICIRIHRDLDNFFRAIGALPREADYLFKVGRGSHRPRWQSLASVIDDSVPPHSRFRGLSQPALRKDSRESRPEWTMIVSIVTDWQRNRIIKRRDYYTAKAHSCDKLIGSYVRGSFSASSRPQIREKKNAHRWGTRRLSRKISAEIETGVRWSASRNAIALKSASDRGYFAQAHIRGRRVAGGAASVGKWPPCRARELLWYEVMRTAKHARSIT